MQSYKTVKKEAQDEFTEKRSRFIGYIKPVTTEAQALEFIQKIKTKHWDARHNVYAYSLREGNIKRYSDDGEPQGTAGMPVLDVLLKSEITDAVIVVTRYFGGILLGGGGLVRAYSHSASLACQAGEPITMQTCLICTLTCSYNQYGKISSLIPEMGGTIDDSQFTDEVIIQFHISDEVISAFESQLADATSGAVSVEVLGEEYFCT